MFLTAAELVDLTGLKRPKAQYAWLRANGWPVELDARRRPRLLRSVVEARMGGAATFTGKIEPDFGALRGA